MMRAVTSWWLLALVLGIIMPSGNTEAVNEWRVIGAGLGRTGGLGNFNLMHTYRCDK